MHRRPSRLATALLLPYLLFTGAGCDGSVADIVFASLDLASAIVAVAS